MRAVRLASQRDGRRRLAQRSASSTNARATGLSSAMSAWRGDEAHLYPALDQPLHHHLEGVSVPLTVYRLLGLREPRPEYPDDPGAERSVLSA